MGRKSQNPVFNVHDLCARAHEALKAAGFERVAVSMKSEAVYFRLPGRHGLLRVATHKTKQGSIGLDAIVATLTFRGNRFNAPEEMTCSEEGLETMLMIAVGRYIMNSAEPIRSRYQGKRGTWEAPKVPA